MTRMVFAAIVALSIFGCVKKPILSEGAINVRLLTKAEPIFEGCKEIGNVSTGNDWLREVGDVNTYLRNEAAQVGANVVVVDVMEKENNLYKGSGRAFNCTEQIVHFYNSVLRSKWFVAEGV